MTGMMTRPNHDDLVFLKELIEAGKFVPVIDRCYPLAKAAEAHRYVLEGHVRGKVILTNDSPAR
jgi:NADPH:quinone reductase-like Zn-dependent oxidoreductase